MVEAANTRVDGRVVLGPGDDALHLLARGELREAVARQRRGERDEVADLALAPVIDALRSDAELELVPAGAIGCDGATLTVRLYSAVPFEQARRVHADADSHTSVTLARWLLATRFNARPEFVEFDARERVEVAGDTGGAPAEWPETMLMIGDKVVTDSPPAVRYPHQLDLGEAWRAETGLPFVYAVWMRRAGDAPSPRERAAIAPTKPKLKATGAVMNSRFMRSAWMGSGWANTR